MDGVAIALERPTGRKVVPLGPVGGDDEAVPRLEPGVRSFIATPARCSPQTRSMEAAGALWLGDETVLDQHPLRNEGLL